MYNRCVYILILLIAISEPPETKKLFVKGFPEDMSNEMVEKLLKV